MIALAAQNFLNVNRDAIASKINDLLEGNIREIVGAMKLTEMVSDRKSFSDKVQNNVVPDLARFGLELVSFNVQNFFDENGVIENLGIDNVEQIRKNAAIAKSDAQREISIAEAENAKVSNDAKVKAAEEIAKRNNDLAIKQAELKQESDTKKAQADAAMAIEAENQRKLKEIALANANLAKQEKEIELKEREVAIKERALEAEIKKTAEARKYAEQQDADAKLYAAQKAADAAGVKLTVADAGDDAAKQVFDTYLDHLAAACISVVHILDPEVIAIGGGVCHAGDFLFEPLKKGIDEKCFFSEHGKIVPAVMGNDAGIIGAAMLAQNAN
jgi:flotillin